MKGNGNRCTITGLFMDNSLQIEEIKKYQRYLSERTGEEVDEEIAALLWIMKYARY
jgi:hypothetical protein